MIVALLLVALLVAVAASPFLVLGLYGRMRSVEARLAILEEQVATGAPAPAPAAAAVQPAEAASPFEPSSIPEPAPEPEPQRRAARAAMGRVLRRWLRETERSFAERWMIWLGGIAVALAAVFLFRFAVEEGWLGPRARIGLGLVLGAALVAGGTWAHRRPLPETAARMPPGYAGPALTAAGIFTLYASLYAAYGLYGLVGPAADFAALAAISFLALGLARGQGWFVALLGIAGGYLVPALISTDAPAALPVFGYLLALTLGGLALVSIRPWWFLEAAVLVGALLWPLGWILVSPIPDQGVLGGYLIAVAALFGLLGGWLPWADETENRLTWASPLFAHTAGPGFILAGLLLSALAAANGYNGAGFLLLGVYASLGMLLALRHPVFEPLALAGALVVAATLIGWPQPIHVSPPAELQRLGVAGYADSFGPFVLPPEYVAFARALLGFGLLFGAGGFAALRFGATPGFWAALSTAMPLGLLALGYARIGAFGIDLRWSGMAVALSLACLGAALSIPRLLPRPARDLPLGIYAAGSTAALALAFACVMRDAWLTVAVGLQVTALAWILGRLPLRPLRITALAAIAAVMARLVLNPYLVHYTGGVGPFAWVIYGYGLPGAAFLAAGHLLRRAVPDDPLADVAETAGIVLLFLMVALQLRIWTAGSLETPGYTLTDMAMQSLWWLIASLLLLRPATLRRLPAARHAGLGLLALAGVQLAVGHLIAANPLFVEGPVGTAPLLNLLAVAYLAPAMLLGLIGWSAGAALPKLARPLPGALAGLLAFAWVTLETRHAFQGTRLLLAPDTRPVDGELYAYSVVWIVFAMVLLAVGILRDSPFWRGFSLAVLGAAALKVFLYDTSDLGGLWRVASFLGLGLSLIGIGQLYRRFVLSRRGAVG